MPAACWGRGPCTFPLSAKPASAVLALDPLSTPTSLVLSQVTSSSVHLSWTPAPQPPLKYLVVWRPSRGGVPREVRDDPLPAPCKVRAGMRPWVMKSAWGRSRGGGRARDPRPAGAPGG